ncbi:hypothetical protein DEU56DRAFT_722451 [Suillus clintonianus]|uniref:uncharacterized protein n=1 Tax=Suillus clintonianus TaxID=1904413 RepID=UPI001B886ACE|nr:uncharacterized protein DEU56DRAFT_722451 [Suillus clintonianus]KAG2157036.1 hypothetical protein DEU56DRAFT_722451 [Suillus clintonianus]
MTDTQHSVSLLYQIEHLGEGNWIPWKTKVLAILGDEGYKGHVDSTNLKLEKGPDPKARTIIVLLVSDAQMVHLTRANTAKEM